MNPLDLLTSTFFFEPPNDGGSNAAGGTPSGSEGGASTAGGSADLGTGGDDVMADTLAALAEVSAREAGTPDAGTDVPPADRGAPSDATIDRGDGRTARGQFVARKADTGRAGDKPVDADRGGVARTPDAGAQAGAQTGGPPTSWSPRSKASWDQLKQAFPTIAEDVAKREADAAAGFAALKDYKDIKPYQEMAASSGTTLAEALHRYTNLETLCRSDVRKGLMAVCTNLGLPQAEAAEIFSALGYALGARRAQPASDRNGVGDGGREPDRNGQDPFLRALAPVLSPILEAIKGIEGKVDSRIQADRKAFDTTLDAAITAFGADPANVYFPDLENDISMLFERGVVPLTGNHASDLRNAYDMAARMHPEISELLIEQRLNGRGTTQRQREQEAADKARRASRSLAGSQTPGVRTEEQPRAEGGHSDDVQADVIRAMRQHSY